MTRCLPGAGCQQEISFAFRLERFSFCTIHEAAFNTSSISRSPHEGPK
jgi:hypothetical protein